MNVYLVIIAVVIIILTLRIKINLDFEYNLLNNIGSIKVKLFKFVTIFNSKITIIGDYLNFSSQKAKVIKVKLDINDINIKFFNELSRYLKQKIYPVHLATNVNFCLENPFMAAILSNSINLILSNMFFNIKLKNNEINVANNVTTGYRHNIIILNFSFSFIITIYDLIWSLIKTTLVIRREHEKEKHAI